MLMLNINSLLNQVTFSEVIKALIFIIRKPPACIFLTMFFLQILSGPLLHRNLYSFLSNSLALVDLGEPEIDE